MAKIKCPDWDTIEVFFNEHTHDIRLDFIRHVHDVAKGITRVRLDKRVAWRFVDAVTDALRNLHR